MELEILLPNQRNHFCLKKVRLLLIIEDLRANLLRPWTMLIKLKLRIDPRGRPTVMAVSDHYFRTCCLSVPTFQNLTKQNNCQSRIVFATGETVGLAEWIIDGTHVLYLIAFPVKKQCHSNQVHFGLKVLFYIALYFNPHISLTEYHFNVVIFETLWWPLSSLFVKAFVTILMYKMTL